MTYLPAILCLFYGFSLGAPYSLGKLLITAVAGLWLALGPIYRHKGDWRVLAYLACVSVASVVSLDPWTSLWHLHGTHTAGLVAALALVPFWACVGEADYPDLVKGLRIAALLVSVVGLLQWAGVTWDWVLPFDLSAGRRVYSTVGSPVYLGALLALCLPFCRGFEIGPVVACLIATGSRGAWVAAAVGQAYRYWPRLSTRVRVYGSLSVLVGGLSLILRRPASDVGRFLVWETAVKGFLDHPWTGWGPGTYYVIAEHYRTPLWDLAFGGGTQDQAHNLILEAASTMGVLGLAGLACLLPALWPKDRTARAAMLAVGVVGMLNPLPVIVKALCLSLAACTAVTPHERIPSRLIKVLACNILLAVMFLVCLDRRMEYGRYPWSYSATESAYLAGVIRFIHPRETLKL